LKEIKIPFQDAFREKMLSGVKTMTSRTKHYTQDEGDYFNIFGATFVITRLYRMHLCDIAEECWYQEGCESPDHFRVIWNRLHPRKGWQPNQLVCCHEFRKMTKPLVPVMPLLTDEQMKDTEPKDIPACEQRMFGCHACSAKCPQIAEAQRDADMDWHNEVVAEILKHLNMRDVGGEHPEWAMSDKEYQELKSEYLPKRKEYDEK